MSCVWVAVQFLIACLLCFLMLSVSLLAYEAFHGVLAVVVGWRSTRRSFTAGNSLHFAVPRDLLTVVEISEMRLLRNSSSIILCFFCCLLSFDALKAEDVFGESLIKSTKQA